MNQELANIVVAVLLVANLIVGFVLLLRRAGAAGSGLETKFDQFGIRLAEIQAVLRSGLTGMREEASSRIEGLSSSLTATIGALGKQQGERLDGFVSHLADMRSGSELYAKALREELTGSFDKLSTGLASRASEQAGDQTRRFDSFGTQLADHRTANAEDAKALREEIRNTLSELGGRLAEALSAASQRQTDGLTGVTTTVKELAASNETRQEQLRQTIEGRLDAIRSENSEKLEQMRVTVDEKLQGTLEQRLGASFNQVNENLERVFKSVGEMQAIATGVGDLKRVLSNVKSRGIWGEGTLGLLLEQVMTTEQYAENVEVRPDSGERVEYAIRLPGEGDSPLWLPIDAKLPMGDYERLVEASERGDPIAVEEAAKGIERAIRLAGRHIADRYIYPPHTTDFGVMFLPTEGLFAEVVRRPGLVDSLQRDCRVIVAGPTTLMAILTSLRMGFRSLAIQQRSSEVWQVLGAVKTEFGKFGAVLDKVQKKLGEAQNVVEQAGVRKRAVDRQLKAVEALPEATSQNMLAKISDEIVDEIDLAEAAA